MNSFRRPPWGRVAWVGGGLALGVLALAWVVRDAGVETTRALIARSVAWLPLALAIEGLRIAVEFAATHRLFSMLRSAVPRGPLARIQMIGYAIGNVVPAGRAVAEATKVGLVAPFAGVARAAAVAAATQGLHLAASGCILALSALAALSTSHRTLITTLAAQSAVLVGLGAFVLVVGRVAPMEGRWFARLPRFGAGLRAFRRALLRLPAVPVGPFAWILASRGLQVVLIGVLAHAVGCPRDPRTALVGEGLLLTGASMGDFVPGQIGAVEGAFALFSADLGASRPNAIAVALLVHFVQTFWVVMGFFALAYDGERRPASRGAPRGITTVSP
jgi:uncharacterized membrane protein YbhN (UPF0104 family)